MAKQVEQLYGKPDAIAGVATGAIGIGALVADVLGVPFVYVRPQPKAHGRQNQIEGHIEQHRSVVIIEDLISTGKSSLNAAKALKRESNAHLKGLVAVFSYGFDMAMKNFKNENLDCYSLSNYEVLIQKAFDTRYLNRKELKMLESWHVNPKSWNTNN